MDEEQTTALLTELRNPDKLNVLSMHRYLKVAADEIERLRRTRAVIYEKYCDLLVQLSGEG